MKAPVSTPGFVRAFTSCTVVQQQPQHVQVVRSPRFREQIAAYRLAVASDGRFLVFWTERAAEGAPWEWRMSEAG